MKKVSQKITGAAIAVAAATLMGCTTTHSGNSASTATAQGGTTDLVHCYSVNQCKGHNDCKTAENACAGHAECKGHGFVAMPSKACDDIGGKIKDSYRGTIAESELVHCYGVNQCKGHNDCKTAENACAGHAECKGHGFVAMPAKSCGDVGGKEGA
ncbi:hypothetical protein [Aliikangiella coralliicola]|uniref:Lipoprotein n=1 Tax=Aliikangiella coralliicola TaxID=2592383 RepID=A0A545UAA7_9GAMM|nr:hypothetical protein [Aliikangiella coralliicola]TQV86407.1 hypothetical protein FLL46_15930 [Aliikangiella coralliicola]